MNRKGAMLRKLELTYAPVFHINTNFNSLVLSNFPSSFWPMEYGGLVGFTFFCHLKSFDNGPYNRDMFFFF
ncbi:hypothetical protein SLEP1_g36791 [Rubroshorea leprosula]|uniref:Uncharacterized protein n=1 Tax=Rubroshorea leprosula TaxID=152421 RepID=A0AAV5KT47_9ROSI|nr:hypothetical protein SLEP1_g36791 [Rubroshorea leprosula]